MQKEDELARKNRSQNAHGQGRATAHSALYHASEGEQCPGKSIKGKSSGRDFPQYILPTSATHGWGLTELEVKPISPPVAAFEGSFLGLLLSVFLVWTSVPCSEGLFICNKTLELAVLPCQLLGLFFF